MENGGERKIGGKVGSRKLRLLTHAKNLPRACVRECVLRVFTAIRVAAEGAARSVAVSPYRFLCNYN